VTTAKEWRRLDEDVFNQQHCRNCHCRSCLLRTDEYRHGYSLSLFQLKCAVVVTLKAYLAEKFGKVIGLLLLLVWVALCGKLNSRKK
jgi:hypothetical protein